VLGGDIPTFDRWATITGRYEGANAEKAVPFPGRHPSILVSFVLCPHADGQRVPQGFEEQHALKLQAPAFIWSAIKEARV